MYCTCIVHCIHIIQYLHVHVCVQLHLFFLFFLFQSKHVASPVGQNFADQQSLSELTQLVNGMQQEQERLIGTAAHLSHELDISKEHTKVQCIYD